MEAASPGQTGRMVCSATLTATGEGVHVLDERRGTRRLQAADTPEPAEMNAPPIERSQV